MQHDDNDRTERRTVDVHVMQARIEMLFEALGEVKTLLKSLDETVSLIRVFDMQIKQQGGDVSRLELDVREYKRNMDALENQIRSDVAEVKRLSSDESDRIKEIAESTKNTLQSKVSYVQGALAGISVLGAILYGATVWFGSRSLEMLEGHDRYVQTLQTLHAEEHLREGMNKAPAQVELDRKPVVTDGSSDSGRSLSDSHRNGTPRM